MWKIDADYGWRMAPSSPKNNFFYASYIDEPVMREKPSTHERLSLSSLPTVFLSPQPDLLASKRGSEELETVGDNFATLLPLMLLTPSARSPSPAADVQHPLPAALTASQHKHLGR
jgi:hypothetical protein